MKEHDLYPPDRLEGCAACHVCRGFEGSLPTECPGRRMTSGEQERVYAGVLDFKNGQWENLPQKGLVIRMKHWMPGMSEVPLTAVDRWSASR